MIGYASRTGTRRNLDALRVAGWRLLVSAAGSLRNEGFPYALDNGAWSAYTQGRPFNEPLFVRALRKLGDGADWTVIPDIVAGGAPSLALSLRWMRQVLDETPRALLAVQDGIAPADVRPFLGARVGIFVGGSTPWKLQTMPLLAPRRAREQRPPDPRLPRRRRDEFRRDERLALRRDAAKARRGMSAGFTLWTRQRPMTAAERRRLVALSEWTDREWAIFALGYEAGVDLARRAAWDALTEATRKATRAKRAAAAIHEHPTSIREAILRTLSEESP